MLCLLFTIGDRKFKVGLLKVEARRRGRGHKVSRSCLQMIALGKGKISSFRVVKLAVSATLYGRPGSQE